MKSMTLQLFEYLLAVQNCKLTTIRNLDEYPMHWFFDELLAYQNVELVRDTHDKMLVIKPPQPQSKRSCFKAQKLYDAFLKIAKQQTETALSLNFGVGLLYMGGLNPVSHPILTMNLDVTFNYDNEQIKLHFGNGKLGIDRILNYALFYGTDIVAEIKAYVQDLALDPFDQHQVAIVMQKIIEIIHPRGQYFASLKAASLCDNQLPYIVNIAMIYPQTEAVQREINQQLVLLERQKAFVKYLRYHQPSAVLEMVANFDPAYSQNKTSPTQVLKIEDLCYLWPTIGVEHQILSALEHNSAVTVLDSFVDFNNQTAVNLLTHLAATGKRVLVVGENAQTLADLQTNLPEELAGIHSKLPNDVADLTQIEADLATLLAKKADPDFNLSTTAKLQAEIELANNELLLLIEKIATTRGQGSRKNYWHGERYYPTPEQSTKQPVNEQPTVAEKSDDQTDFWQLRPYFTAANKELLNYEFIDLGELTELVIYQQMLALEGKCLQQTFENPGLDKIFDEDTDVRFIHYLHTELPNLIQELSKITTKYSENVLKQALVDIETYYDLTAALGHVNVKLKGVACFDGPVLQRELLIDLLNTTFGIDSFEMETINVNDSRQLWDFYQTKKSELTVALDVTNTILTFNNTAMELSDNFIGITADGLEMLVVLYEAVTLNLNKIEFEQSWQTVREYFIEYFNMLETDVEIHPSCVALYEALHANDYEEFKNCLANIQQFLLARNNFVTFAENIENFNGGKLTSEPTILGINHPSPTNHVDDNLLGQMSVDKSELLEHGVDYLLDYLLQLQMNLIECTSVNNLKNGTTEAAQTLTILLSDKQVVDERLTTQVLTTFGVVFMPLANTQLLANHGANLFDVVVFVDASKSNILRINELNYAPKAVLFGHQNDECQNPLKLNYYDFNHLTSVYGETVSNFGRKYLQASLFELLASKISRAARIKLDNYEAHDPLNELGATVATGVKNCATHIEDEIFDALITAGYQVKCKVTHDDMTLDFLVIGTNNMMAINVLGDAKIDHETMIAQITKEVELRKKGLPIRTIQAAHFYLNSRQILAELYEHLEKLGISPKK